MDIIPRDDEGRAKVFETFRDNFPNYRTILGIPASDNPIFVQQAADATYFRALLNLQATVQSYAQALTKWRNYERDGGAVAVPTPPLPVLPEDFPAAVPPGIVPRFRAIYKLISARPTCTPAILEALGFDKQVQAGPDLETLKPLFAVKKVGGQPFVDWGWMNLARFLDNCEIVVDRSDSKGEVFLTIDSTPGYLDTFPLPATPTKWTYRIIYRIGDSRVGVWSDPVSIIAGG